VGHQVNFYATPTDIEKMEEGLRNLEPMIVLHSRSTSAAPRVLRSLILSEEARPWLYFFLVREGDLGEVVTRQIPSQGYWSIDVVRSPVVEFSSGNLERKALRRGRVYYIEGFYGEGEVWIEKSEDFRKWAKSVVSFMKSALKKQGTEYAGSDALAWQEREGGAFIS
jgi:hypothetical protein